MGEVRVKLCPLAIFVLWEFTLLVCGCWRDQTIWFEGGSECKTGLPVCKPNPFIYKLKISLPVRACVCVCICVCFRVV